MSFEEMVVALVGAIGAFALVGYLAAKTIDLIKTWMNRNKSGISEKDFNRLAEAFIEYKKESKRRIENLEAIIVDDEPAPQKSSDKNNRMGAPRNSIEIDESSEESSSQSSGLRNMLHD